TAVSKSKCYCLSMLFLKLVQFSWVAHKYAMALRGIGRPLRQQRKQGIVIRVIVMFGGMRPVGSPYGAMRRQRNQCLRKFDRIKMILRIGIQICAVQVDPAAPACLPICNKIQRCTRGRSQWPEPKHMVEQQRYRQTVKEGTMFHILGR